MKNKSLVSNSIFNILYSGLNVLFPMITAMYVSRVLSPSGIGIVSSAQNVATYFVMIAALGIPIYGVKAIGKYQADNEKRDKTFSELFFINAVTTLFSSLAYYALIYNVEQFKVHIEIYNVIGILVFLNIINVDWFFQGIEEFKYITARSFFVKLILLVFMFLFVRTKENVLQYALISCLSTTANYLLNAFYIKRFVTLRFSSGYRQHIKPIVMLSLVTLALEIYSLCDITMLTFMCDEAMVGYYTNVVKIKNIVVNTLIAVLTAMMPRLSYYYEQKEYYKFDELINSGQKFIMLIAIPISTGILLLSGDIILVMFGKNFLPATHTLQIASVAMFVIPIGQLLGYRMLVLTDNESRMVPGFLIGAAINLILNFFLIQKLYQNGAMIASVISEIIVACFNIFMARSFIRFKIEKNFIISEGIALSSMIIVVLFVKRMINVSILRLIISAILGGFAYFIVGYIMKNDFILKIVDFILDKLKKK